MKFYDGIDNAPAYGGIGYRKAVKMLELVESRVIVFCRISVGTIINAAINTPLQILLLLIYCETILDQKEQKLKKKRISKLKTTIT